MQSAPSEQPLASLLSFQRRRANALRLSGIEVPTALAGTSLRSTRRIWYRSALVCAAALLVLVFGLALFRSTYDGRVYPAVAVAGMPVGGQSEADARASIANRAAEMEQGFITFSYAGSSWSPALADIGVTIDTESASEEAMAIGREDGAWDRLSAVSGLVQEDQEIPFQVDLDYETMAAWFDSVDADLGLTPHDAYLVIEGRDVRIEPEQNGTIVDREAAYRQIETALRDLAPLDAPLPVTVWTAKVNENDLAEARATVEEAVSRNIKVEFQDEDWTLRIEELGQFIVQTVDPNPSLIGAAAFSVTIDEKALASWLNEKFAAKINLAPVDAEVAWNGTEVVAMTASQEGYTLKARSFARIVGASMFGDHGRVEIPVSTVAPAVDSNNLGALGITVQLGRGDSNYAGSNYTREVNVSTGVGLLNGTLIPPGGEFDFNRAIGEITADKGYVEADVIAGEQIARDIGGGICQVSTTVFRAALLAGVPITEWNPHRYQLANYERDGWGPGYDASILQPEGDPFQPGNSFKFLNPTNSWMLVEAYNDGVNVIVTIYGAPMGYTVELSDPVPGAFIEPEGPLEVVDDSLPPGSIEQTQWARWGRAYTTNRTIFDADGTVVESRDFGTTFWSSGNTWTVSPDLAGQSPAKTGIGIPELPPKPAD